LKAASAIAVVLLAALFAVVAFGLDIRWQDAYRALGVTDGGPHALAQAQAEDEPPQGMPLQRRLHPPGTVARLRYEQLDEAGTTFASYELRALLPPLPYFGREAPGSELGEIECRAPCREQLKTSGAVLIDRSGKAGMATEWLLRMPVGKAFALGKRSLEIQDIGQEKPRSIAQSRLRVTLLETCAARLRVGAATHVEFAPYAMIPIPTGLRTTRWVQLENCEAMMAAAPTAAQLGPPVEPPKPAQRLRRSWPDPAPMWEAVRPRRDGALGRLTLNVDETWLANNGQPLVFRLLRACRYQAPEKRWIPLAKPEADGEIALRDKPAAAARVAYRFPEDSALYFAEWAEIGSGGTGKTHSALVPSGGVACRDHPLPPATAGEVVACVPAVGISDAQLVPAPELHCSPGAEPAAISTPARR